MRDRERQRHRQREKQAPCGEPDAGLDSGSPGSYPRPKAAPNHWAIGAALLFFFFFFKILFIYDRHRERGRDTGRGRSRLHAGSPMCDPIPGPQDHSLGQRQALNC